MCSCNCHEVQNREAATEGISNKCWHKQNWHFRLFLCCLPRLFGICESRDFYWLNKITGIIHIHSMQESELCGTWQLSIHLPWWSHKKERLLHGNRGDDVGDNCWEYLKNVRNIYWMNFWRELLYPWIRFPDDSCISNRKQMLGKSEWKRHTWRELEWALREFHKGWDHLYKSNGFWHTHKIIKIFISVKVWSSLPSFQQKSCDDAGAHTTAIYVSKGIIDCKRFRDYFL